MKDLLAIEWLKIKKYRTFRILAIMFLLLLPVWNWGIYSVVRSKPGASMFLSTAYSFPEVWGNLGFWGGLFVLVLSILMIILVCNEYSFRTHRQNVIDGWTRLDFLHSKAALVLIGGVLATLYVLVVGLIMGFSIGGASGIGGGWEKLLFFFIYTINYLGFATLIALWIRRSGLAIGLFFLYAFILENIFSSLINLKAQPVGNLLPLQASDELLPLPIAKLFGNMIFTGPRFDSWIYALVSLLWIGVYYLAAKRLILKRDF
ncbi:MAG: hypothetical protein EOP52_10130 [Sphingobacteriales bacterium]|nr:MAG: hypothetical protein EOP52_10130 [Sphingobacteriales bacterium]